MATIFISYSRKNIDFVRKLAGALQANALDFWVDWDGIPPTVDWMQEIQKGIEEADTFLFVISPTSLASAICLEELTLAEQNGKRLIPIVAMDIENSEVPPTLAQLNYIFCREDDDFDAAMTQLLTAVNTDYEWVQAQRRLQVKALEWERGHEDSSFLLRGKNLEEAEEQLSINATKNPLPTDIQREYVLRSRQATDRQRKITTGALLLIIIVLIGITIWVGAPRVLSALRKAEAQSLEVMISIPAGPVNIGTDDPLALEAYPPESPAWLTDLPDFSLDKYEVSNRLYRLCVQYGDCTPPVRAAEYFRDAKLDHPVVYVTVVQAATYCNWVGRRLPTELEWERVVRGPVNAERQWPWGDEPGTADRTNMYTDVFSPTGTIPISDLPGGASGEGVHNLVGNVWEWTSSNYQESYTGYDPNLTWDGQSKAFAREELFVQRGGGWRNPVERVTSRYWTFDLDAQPDAGFRCASG